MTRLAALAFLATLSREPEWFLAGGLGSAVSLGATESDVLLALVAPQWGTSLSSRVEYVIEGHFAGYVNPEGLLAGVLPLGVRVFTGDGPRRLYLTAGAGFGWTDLTGLPEIDRRFNFLFQGGIGLRWKARGKRDGLLEIRLLHVSNGNTADRNLGLNSIALVAGWRVR